MEKELALSLMTEREHLLQKISILKNSIPSVDVYSRQCPFCNMLQDNWIENNGRLNKLLHFCACSGMRQYQENKHHLFELKDRLSVIEDRFEQERIRARKCLTDGGMGKRFQSCCFDNYEQEYMPKAYEMALKFAKNFMHNDGNGLILTGDVGTGKTHLAAAIANYITEEYAITVEFVSFVNMLADIRAAFSNNTGNDAVIESKLCKAPLLIIDDLGKEKQSQFTSELLYRVVNKRYMENLPLIITTNYMMPELAKKIDYAVFSRIAHLCKAVDMSGADYRVREFRAG